MLIVRLQQQQLFIVRKGISHLSATMFFRHPLKKMLGEYFDNKKLLARVK